METTTTVSTSRLSQHNCPFYDEHITVGKEACQRMCHVFLKNKQMCTKGRCTSPWRICHICITQGDVGEYSSPVNPLSGLCKFHHKNGKDSGREKKHEAVYTLYSDRHYRIATAVPGHANANGGQTNARIKTSEGAACLEEQEEKKGQELPRRKTSGTKKAGDRKTSPRCLDERKSPGETLSLPPSSHPSPSTEPTKSRAESISSKIGQEIAPPKAGSRLRFTPTYPIHPDISHELCGQSAARGDKLSDILRLLAFVPTEDQPGAVESVRLCRMTLKRALRYLGQRARKQPHTAP